MPQLHGGTKLPCYQGPCTCQGGIELDNPLKYQLSDLNYDHHHPHLFRKSLSCFDFKLKVYNFRKVESQAVLGKQHLYTCFFQSHFPTKCSGTLWDNLTRLWPAVFSICVCVCLCVLHQRAFLTVFPLVSHVSQIFPSLNNSHLSLQLPLSLCLHLFDLQMNETCPIRVSTCISNPHITGGYQIFPFSL